MVFLRLDSVFLFDVVHSAMTFQMNNSPGVEVVTNNSLDWHQWQ